MYLIEEDSYTCPWCGCVVKREELSNPPEFRKAIAEKDNVQCPNCEHFGMNYMTKGHIGYGMIGYTSETRREAEERMVRKMRYGQL